MPDDPAKRPAPARPRRLAHYELHAVAGRGAASTVYRATDLRTGQAVALKILPRSADPSLRQSLATEMRAAQALEHPNIVRVLESGEAAGRNWLALEWLPGHDLSRYAAARWRLPDVLAVGTVHAVALALDHAHRRGVLHRDIKPGNIRLHLAAGVVKLGDFGLAALHDGTPTISGLIRGTPAYMAPELLAGAPSTAASDLYTLGVVAYELLASRRPHEADSLGELLRQVVGGPARPLMALRPDLPPALHELVARLLERDPARRPARAAEVADSLARVRAEWAPS
jgi:serine/threonine protein kinase